MANNNLLFDNIGTNDIIDKLHETKTNYESNITILENKINEISSSNDWIDEALKTAFVETAESYLKIFKEIISYLAQYETTLKNKTSTINEVENIFS